MLNCRAVAATLCPLSRADTTRLRNVIPYKLINASLLKESRSMNAGA